MSIIKKKVFKNYPYILKAKKKGYFDFSQSVMPSDEQPVFEMKKYTPGLHSILDSYESPLVVSLENSILPDYTYFDETSRVFCEYGKYYRGVMSQHKTIDGLVGDIKFEQSGIITDFSSTNYMEINKPVTVSTGTFIFKVFFTSGTNTATILKNLDATPEKYMGASGSSPYCYGIYNSGWTLSSNPQEKNVWKFVRLEIRDGTSTMYTLDAGEYTLDTLPELSGWREECKIDSNLYSSEKGFQIGANKNWSDGYFRGHIDLSQSKIIINDELYWSYEPITYIVNKDYNGCLLNYTDTGVATSIDMYSVTKPGYQDFILTKDTNPTLEGYKLQYLKTISIPQHDTYSYSETEGYAPGNFISVGNSSCWDSTNYIFTGEEQATYLSLNNALTDADNIELLIKVNLDTISSNSAFWGSKPNRFWLGVQSGYIGGWLPSGKFITSIPVETGVGYFKYVNNSEGFKVYYQKDSSDNMPLVYSSSKVSLSCDEIIFGANYDYWDENMHGSLDFRNSYLKVNDTVLFGPTLIPVWTKK